MKSSILFVFLILSIQGMGQTLIDSYEESNRDSYIQYRINAAIGVGQSFANSNAATLSSCKFYIARYGPSASGYVKARLYAHSGVYGTSSVATGGYLAVSDSILASSLGTGYSLITFSFSGSNAYNMSASTYYVMMCWYTVGTASQTVRIGVDASSPSHGGNYNYYSLVGPTWGYDNIKDVCFYVYGTVSGGGGSTTLISTINGVRQAVITTNNGVPSSVTNTINGVKNK